MKHDSDIVSRIITDGTPQAYKALVDKHQASVFTICYRILKNRQEAEESAQDVFLKCFRDIDKLEDKSKLRGWLLKIAYTKSIDRIRLKKMTTVGIENSNDKILIESHTPFSEMNRLDRRKILTQCIDKLEKEQATVITLFYLEDLPIKEIATITNQTIGNTKVKLHRARINLKIILEKMLNSEISDIRTIQ